MNTNIVGLIANSKIEMNNNMKPSIKSIKKADSRELK